MRCPGEAMQVSIACTEHNLKSRNGEDRLLSKQSANAPNVNAARAKFRTVAIIARSLGTFTPQHHISLKESTAKQTGMKYRYGSELSPSRGLSWSGQVRWRTVHQVCKVTDFWVGHLT